MWMRYAVLLSLLVAVTGCLPHQSKDLASCVAEAERFYHIYDAVDLENPGSKYVISCMAAKGYQFSILTSDCDIRRPMPTQATCYEPTSWQPWVIDRVFRALKITAHTSWRVGRVAQLGRRGRYRQRLASIEKRVNSSNADGDNRHLTYTWPSDALHYRGVIGVLGSNRSTVSPLGKSRTHPIPRHPQRVRLAAAVSASPIPRWDNVAVRLPNWADQLRNPGPQQARGSALLGD